MYLGHTKQKISLKYSDRKIYSNELLIVSCFSFLILNEHIRRLKQIFNHAMLQQRFKNGATLHMKYD